MDVVSRNIENLRGRVEIHSERHRGLSVRMRFPITLAILEGFHVRVKRTDFVIPLEYIMECREFSPDEKTEERYIRYRGELLPYIRLREYYSEEGGDASEITSEERDRSEKMLVIHYRNRTIGFIVDELLGETRSILKAPGRLLRWIRGINGLTVLGSGVVAFVPDLALLFENIFRRE